MFYDVLYFEMEFHGFGREARFPDGMPRASPSEGVGF